MKYLDKSFSTPANSQAYVEGWKRCFGEEAEEPERQEPGQPAQVPENTTEPKPT